jgi:excisionase family DNA binding protein
MMWDLFPDYRRRRAEWEASLAQETYTVGEAALALRISESTVRRLLDRGELYSENPGKRMIRIPKAAIIRYMVGPHPMEGLLGKTRG